MIVKIGQSPFVLVVESFNQKTGVRHFVRGRHVEVTHR